ncbi:hypothetical protein K239x_04660 [Planctomycetes bacterium K23_9]|uniref:Uncharacterized protein n=2 Tax=Stieleria marina TaxID=1930275 RepID=A0A517NN24_9BACT|nr:hypothetical protein K239x_04660 [Planctomycetes bacterium K23_9]
MLVLAAAILGMLSLAAFCYAWGLNFQDEGWTQPDGSSPMVNRPWLIASAAGASLATLLFWIGLVQLTRQNKHIAEIE